MSKLKNRAKDGPIKWPAMNITLISGATLSLGVVLTRFHDAFKELFGYLPGEHPGPAAAIFVSLVVAIGLVVAADMLARGVASSRVGNTVAMPEGWTATVVASEADEPGYAVAAVSTTAAGPEFLVAKEGKTATWRTLGTTEGSITLQAPATGGTS